MTILEPLRNEKGLALLLVLLVITLLVAMVVEFDYKTRIDLRSAGNLRDGLQATYLAKAGVAAAQAVLKDDSRQDQLHPPATDNLTEAWAIPLPPLPLGDGTVSVTITDEASKFNINNLVTQAMPHQKRQSAVAQAKTLFQLVQADPNLVDAIVDWMDTDDSQEADGAEESYYQSLPKPYHCKNKPMDSLSELHMIKGITDEVYQKVSPYLTVSTVGVGATNLNTADKIVLQALLDFDEEAVKRLIDKRPFKSFQDVIDLYHVGSTELNSLNTNQLLISFTTNVFSVKAVGRVHDTEKTVQATLERPGGVVRVKAWRVE